MNLRRLVRLASVVVAFGLWGAPAFADTAEATCKVKKDGDTRKHVSGPCTFSQRQGYVNIDLRNGASYSLSPGQKANHFEDQNGKKVERTASGDEHVYKWEDGLKIVVTFDES